MRVERRRRLSIIVLACIFTSLNLSVVSCTNIVVSDLAGKWNLTNGYNVTSTGTVPGDIFTDLMTAGIIGDPYYRFNDIDYRWISLANWTYSVNFDITEDMMQKTKIILWFEGLDTIANITVNGIQCGTTDNMFRRYIFDITNKIHRGPQTTSNLLQIQFTSASSYANQKKNEAGYNIPYTQTEWQHGLPNRNFIRKAQCHFSWDWGPCFLTQGVWKPVKVIAYSSAIIEYVTPTIIPIVKPTQTNYNNTSWLLSVKVYLNQQSTIDGEVTLNILNQNYTNNIFRTTMDPQLVFCLFNITIVNPNLWWPRGYGDATLYNMTVIYSSQQYSEYQSIVQQIGFRSIELIEKAYDDGSPGLSFYLQVNGYPVFAKGSNWIPADSFESRVTDKVIEKILTSAVEANMNTIRNWGGGIYQHDYFYEFCDRNGLMVWEEFMFACAMYPRDNDFLMTVREEIKHQVRRLMYHPSIIIWSGNNENEAALGGWYEETRENPYRYVVDYNYLNTETVRNTLLEFDISRPWLPSSPSNGVLRIDPYVERWGNVYSNYYGDVHYYNYKVKCTDVSNYPTPRFASEFGFQSFDSLYTLAPVTMPSDWQAYSHAMLHRQHHPNGTDELLSQMKLYFNIPQNVNSTVQFEDWIYLTQCVQAMCISAETEHYRRLKSQKANTMGALYWQLNSIWPAPSWSSLEYGGRWKLLHYSATRFFAPLLISSYIQQQIYSVYLISDYYQQIEGTYSIIVYDWTGKVLQDWSDSILLSNFASVNIFSKNLNDLYQDINSSPNNTFFHLTFNSQTTNEVVTNVFFPTSFAEVVLPVALISLSNFVQVNSNEVKMIVTSNAVAPFVFVSTSYAGRFSDNGFLLLPNVSFSLQFFAAEAIVDLSSFSSSLQTRTIRNTYP